MSGGKKEIYNKRIYMFGLSSLLLLSLVATNDVSSEANIISTATDVDIIQTKTEETSKTSLPVIITNTIEPDMLKYKHWTGTYSPDVFNITINGTAIDKGQSYTLDSAENSLIVQFDYSFMNGMRKGTKKVTYQMNTDCTDAKLTFSWLDTYKIIIDNATPIKEETV
jgi:hypothetical protein